MESSKSESGMGKMQYNEGREGDAKDNHLVIRLIWLAVKERKNKST